MGPERRSRREAYIDAFRGLMALVMVQGHLYETLLSPASHADPVYRFQVVFHGSTAPGFLFASGFVAGLPRAPLSLKASLRRARRLLFVLAVGYALHLPYFSFWKILLQASPGEKALLFACDALQAIAVFRLILPSTWLRLAGGRERVLGELQALGLLAGANALIVGNYLTTIGRSAEADHALLEALGMPVADGPGEGRFIVDATGAHSRPAKRTIPLTVT